MKKLIFQALMMVLAPSILLVACSQSYTTPPDRAYLYLEDNLNSSINLIRESPDTGSPQDKTYWLANDNLLASCALKFYDPELSKKIMVAIEKYGYKHDHYVEILFGTSTIEPTHAVSPKPNIFEENKDYIIQTEIVTDTVMTDYAQYFDKLCYKALWEAYGGNSKKVDALFNDAVNMWDGHGFNDIVFKNSSNKDYATFKLALLYYTARVLGKLDGVTFKAELLSTIHKLQDAANGGFHTSYTFDNAGNMKITGSTNTETTSLVLIALYYIPKALP
jgi:hypothetical protein